MRAALFVLMLSACGTAAPPAAPLVDLDDVPLAPGAAVTSRLSRAQYAASVEALFGAGITLSVALEPDTRVDGLAALGAGISATSPSGVEEYEVASYEVATQALSPERREAWMPCVPAATVDEDCSSLALASLARRAWRRPVTDGEVDALVAVASGAASTLNDFWGGLEYGIAAILQSPYFLYRPEIGEADPDGGRRRTAFELATRLSFLITDGPPDSALLDAAEAGELDTTEGLEAQARRLIASPEARRGMRAWLTDVLKLDALDHLDKDPELFPNISATLGASAREETLRLGEYVAFDKDTDLRTLLTTRTTFVDRELAAVYRVQAPSLDAFAQIELPAKGERRGLLGQVSFLASHSHSTATSATLRGQAIRESLLCSPLPPPPAGVNTSIPATDAERPTLRDRVTAHLADPSCASCHTRMDLIGLPLENFDAIGRWRDDEAGYPIDASGTLDGVDFHGLSEMADLLAADPMLTDCLVLQVVRRALGRAPGDGEDEMVDALRARFEQQDARLQPLWLDVVRSPMFRRVESP